MNTAEAARISAEVEGTLSAEASRDRAAVWLASAGLPLDWTAGRTSRSKYLLAIAAARLDGRDPILTEAAQAAGISPTTARVWRHKDPSFARAESFARTGLPPEPASTPVVPPAARRARCRRRPDIPQWVFDTWYR